VLDQGSRLSAARLAVSHAAGAALGMSGFDEDGLYANVWMGWRKERSTSKPGYLLAESRRLRRMSSLYNVTSAHLQGEHTAFAANSPELQTFPALSRSRQFLERRRKCAKEGLKRASPEVRDVEADGGERAAVGRHVCEVDPIGGTRGLGN
jgi:hypothetical protein